MCVSMEREHWVYFKKKVVHGAHNIRLYRGWINRLEWNSIAPPPCFPILSPSRLAPSVFSILTQERRKSQQKFLKWEKEEEEKNTLGKKKVWRWDFYYWATHTHTKERGGECQTIAKKKDPRFIQRHTRTEGRTEASSRLEIFMKRVSASSLYYAAQDYIYVKVENKVLLEGGTILN